MSINVYPDWPAKLAKHGYCAGTPAMGAPGSSANNAIQPNNDPPKPAPHDPRWLAEEEVFHQQRVARLRWEENNVEDEP